MFLIKGDIKTNMKNINCSSCNKVCRVEKNIAKVKCGRCCATLGMKKN